MGKRPTRLALAAWLVFWATPVLGQIIVNPRTVEFDPSADHSAVTPDGQPVVLRYDLDIYPAGGVQALYVVDLGKPAPDSDGRIRVDFASRLPRWPLANGTYEARVSAVGATGQGLSDPSNQFAFQSCSVSASPLARTIGAVGGSTSVDVAADSGCGWTAASGVDWITVSPASGSGPAAVTLTATANPGATMRSGFVTVAGQTVTVTQESLSCPFSLGSSGQSFGAAGGTATFSVTTNPGCGWSATSGAAWLGVTPASGNGSASISVTATSNPDAGSRAAQVMIGGLAFTVTQDAQGCSFSLSSTSKVVVATGGTGSVTVSSQAGCSWTASSAASWVTVSPAGATGPGTVTFTAAPNSAAASRAATLMIADRPFTVIEDAAGCQYSLSGTRLRVGPEGGTATLSVTCLGECAWSASTAANWVSVSPSAGTGPGSVTVSVPATTSAVVRTGTFTLGGIVVTVTQDAKARLEAPRGVRVVASRPKDKRDPIRKR